jgi:2,5-diamino-6-(ribosylamino)-4(3H)-pyrimidinone 5'-phosphate reductase
MTADGKIALSNKNQFRISNEDDIKRMYELRNKVDAVLVGIETVLSDDPKLTVKDKYIDNPHHPIRIILDSKCRTPINSKVVNSVSKTLIIVEKKIDKIFNDNVEVIECKVNDDKKIDLTSLLEILYYRGIKELMVEGGGSIIWSFLKLGYVDDLFIYISPIVVGGKKTPTLADGKGVDNIKDLIKLRIVNIITMGDGILIHYKLF